MTTVSIQHQILQAIENDPGAIRALAGAVAQGDTGAIHALLAARGIHISEGEAGDLLQTARGANISTVS